MFSTRKAIAVLVIAGSIGFAGCGDDDESATTTESGATGATGESGSAGLLPADVVAEGNGICAKGNEEIGQAFGQLGKKEPDDQFVQDEIVPNVQGQIDDLRELDDSEELQSVLDEAESTLADIEADPQLFFGADPFADINDELTELGLAACAE